MKPVATFRTVLGLELLLLVAVTHAHTQRIPEGTTASAQDPAVHSTPEGDISQRQPPAEDAKTDDDAGKSVVVNWKLVCQQLCSAGLGGPSCGSAWLRTSTTDQLAEPSLPVDKDTLSGVCPALCANGLGVSKCNCKSFKPKVQFNQHLVCQVFCAIANVRMDGCSGCDGSNPGEGALGALAAVETTTPNWDELCSMFCKMGDGGTLCNCDLPPFF